MRMRLVAHRKSKSDYVTAVLFSVARKDMHLCVLALWGSVRLNYYLWLAGMLAVYLHCIADFLFYS